VTAKHGLEGLSKVTALEGGPHGVTSNAVNPGYVEPRWWPSRSPIRPAPTVSRQGGRRDDLLSESAINRLVEPEGGRGSVGFLASPDAGMVTGASYTMDGGWSARNSAETAPGLVAGVVGDPSADLAVVNYSAGGS